jgi:hypothetical protein
VKATARNTGDAFALQRHAQGRRVLLLLVIKAETTVPVAHKIKTKYRIESGQ